MAHLFPSSFLGPAPGQPHPMARRVLVATILCLALIPATALRADSLADDRFTHLGVEDDLGGRVLDIAQDREGFLWFALQTGLRQYDGSRVKTHLHDPDDPHSISDNYARNLLVDSRENLWIATADHRLQQWIPEEERFRTLDLDLGGEVNDLDEVSPGRLIAVLAGDQTIHIEIDEERAEIIPSLTGVDQITTDPGRQVLWAFAKKELTKRSSDDFSVLETIPLPPSFHFWEGSSFLDSTLAKDGSLWAVVYTGGAIRFQPETREFTSFNHASGAADSLTGDDLATVLEDSAGHIWIGGFSGLNRHQPPSAWKRFTSNPANRRSLVNHQIHSLFEDRTGQIWIGTDFGVARFDPFRENFLFYSQDPKQIISAPQGSIRSFAQDEEGRLWVGSRSHGISRLDREGGETLHFTANPDHVGGLPDNTAWTLNYEAPGRLWVGGESGLSRLDIASGTWQKFDLGSRPGSPRVVSLFRDRLGQLWIGGDNMLNRHDPKTDGIIRIPFPDHVFTRILTMTDDSQGRLYVGTEGVGLVVLDTQSGHQLQSWSPDVFSPGALSQGIVSTLQTVTREGEETIWAGTLAGGLHRLEPDETWSRFGAEQGLPTGSIYTMQAEPSGALWLSFGRETLRFDPESGSVHSFESADGLPSLVHTKASYQSPEGELFFGGLDGFSAFFPDSVRLDHSSPTAVLTDFRVGNQSMRPRIRQPGSPLTESITVTEEVTLKHDQNNFSIELASLHFGDPARNRFAYRLDGVDPEWTEVSAERSFARYSQIPSGRHLFRAKAANRDGIWSQEAQLWVRILPPPWRTWWALTLYFLIALSLLIRWIQAKTARLKLEKELQEKELKILRGLLPICASCKRIRDDEGEWESLESYLDSHSEAKLSHGICPQCTARILKDLPPEPAT